MSSSAKYAILSLVFALVLNLILALNVRTYVTYDGYIQQSPWLFYFEIHWLMFLNTAFYACEVEFIGLSKYPLTRLSVLPISWFIYLAFLANANFDVDVFINDEYHHIYAPCLVVLPGLIGPMIQMIK